MINYKNIFFKKIDIKILSTSFLNKKETFLIEDFIHKDKNYKNIKSSFLRKSFRFICKEFENYEYLVDIYDHDFFYPFYLKNIIDLCKEKQVLTQFILQSDELYFNNNKYRFYRQKSKFINGFSLNNLQNKLENIENIIKILKKIHSIKLNNYGWFSIQNNNNGIFNSWKDFLEIKLDSHIDFCFHQKYISSQEMIFICYLFNTYLPLCEKPDSCLIHGDPNEKNFILTENNEYYVIDWEDSFIGDLIYELAFLTSFHPYEKYDEIIDMYFNGESKPNNFELKFWLYFLRIALIKTIYRDINCLQDDSSMRFPASYRIQYALNKLQKIT